MDKSKIEGFIKRYNLNGCIESVKVTSSEEDNNLQTKFVSEERHVLGNVKLKGVSVGDCELGIYNTAQLKSMLNVLGSDIEISPTSANDRVISLNMKDSTASVDFMLADLSVIQKAPKPKGMPDWDVVIKLDKAFVNTFIKSKSALSEANTFTILTDKKSKKLGMVLGYSSIASNRISIDVETEAGKDVLGEDAAGNEKGAISFSAKYFNEILKSNIDSSDAVLNISAKGIASIKFSTDEYDSEYFLTEIKQED